MDLSVDVILDFPILISVLPEQFGDKWASFVTHCWLLFMVGETQAVRGL